jgi:hypothetical protein
MGKNFNGFGQGQWGISPWGDPTGFDPTVTSLTDKNASGQVTDADVGRSQSVASVPTNQSSGATDTPKNTSTGIAIQNVGS